MEINESKNFKENIITIPAERRMFAKRDKITKMNFNII
jgi:hypothetical protein